MLKSSFMARFSFKLSYFGFDLSHFSKCQKFVDLPTLQTLLRFSSSHLKASYHFQSPQLRLIDPQFQCFTKHR